MTDETPAAETTWLTLPDVAALLGETPGRVSRMIDERAFVAVRRDGVRVVPSAFFLGDRAIPSLRGTIILMQDAGFEDEEIVDWLFVSHPELGNAPIASLRAGRKSEVRRIAQALA